MCLKRFNAKEDKVNHPCLEGCEHNDRTAIIEANERIALLERENELLREQVRLRKELAEVPNTMPYYAPIWQMPPITYRRGPTTGDAYPNGWSVATCTSLDDFKPELTD